MSLTAIQELTYYSHKIVQKGLVAGQGGNTSIRIGDTMWISPSGYTFDEVSEIDWVPVDIPSGDTQEPGKCPSSEMMMHLLIYREREDVEAVVHTHPPITTAIISAGYDRIPHMFPDSVVLAGDIPCIDYVVPCSQELAEKVIEKLKNPKYNGLLLKNHGLITVGKNIKQAYYRTEVVEEAAKIFWISQTVGTPRILSKEEAEQILNLDAEKYRQKLLEKES